MNEVNRELLERVVEKRLTDVLESDLGTDEEKIAFKEAMEAIDREITLRKLDDSYYSDSESRGLEKEKFEASRNEKTALMEFEREKLEASKNEKTALMEFEEKKLGFSNDEQVARRELDERKLTNDEEHRKKESKRAFWIGIGTIVGAVVTPVIGHYSKKSLAKMTCMFEKDYTFTTTVGKSFGSFFRFKD